MGRGKTYKQKNLKTTTRTKKQNKTKKYIKGVPGGTLQKYVETSGLSSF